MNDGCSGCCPPQFIIRSASVAGDDGDGFGTETRNDALRKRVERPLPHCDHAPAFHCCT